MGKICIAAVGDISTGHQPPEPPEGAFVHVLGALRSANIRFGQMERVFSERGEWQQQAVAMHPQLPPRLAAGYKAVPFDVLSLASNNAGDWGPNAVEDTVSTFRLLGISTVGAGRNITEARKPAILEHGGLRVAFLGYVSVTLPQYWANEDRAGTAPMRAHTFYEPYEFQAGAPPRVVTIPHADDLEQLTEDVRKAKQEADLVFVSLHWGVHFMTRPCDYQPIVAHAAIDAGANAILGHHAHQPQGIEIYKDAAIFYSIGNFCAYTSSPEAAGKRHSRCAPNGEYTHQEIYTIEPDPGFVFHYKRHYKEGGIVFFEADPQGISLVTYLPTLMNPYGQPEVLTPDQEQFERSLTYLNWAGKFIKGGKTDIRAAGDRYEVFRRKK